MLQVSSVDPESTSTSSMSPGWFARSEPSAAIVNSNWLCSTMMTLSAGVPAVAKCSSSARSIPTVLARDGGTRSRAAASVIAACDGGAEGKPPGWPMVTQWAKASGASPSSRSRLTLSCTHTRPGRSVRSASVAPAHRGAGNVQIRCEFRRAAPFRRRRRSDRYTRPRRMPAADRIAQALGYISSVQVPIARCREQSLRPPPDTAARTMRVEAGSCAHFRFTPMQPPQAMPECALGPRRVGGRRIQALEVHHRVEQCVALASFCVAVPQIVIVAVGKAPFRQHRIGQVRITLSIVDLIEQPVRGPLATAATAIGIERRGNLSRLDQMCHLRIGAPVPRLVKQRIGGWPRVWPVSR